MPRSALMMESGAVTPYTWGWLVPAPPTGFASQGNPIHVGMACLFCLIHQINTRGDGLSRRWSRNGAPRGNPIHVEMAWVYILLT